MKHNIKKYLSILLAATLMIVSIAIIAACDKKTPEQETSNSVKISANDWSLHCYEDVSLTAMVKDEEGKISNAEVVWKSSDETIATVNKGKVVSLKPGKATITATSLGATDTCNLTVTEALGLPKLKIADEAKLQLLLGVPFTLGSYISYGGLDYKDAQFTYTTNDPTIFTVDTAGAISSLKLGTTTLKVSATWRGVTGISLTETIEIIIIEDIRLNIVAPADVTVYTQELEVDGVSYSNTTALSVKMTSEGTEVSVPADVTWVSSNEEVATVSSSGVITGATEGETAITVTYGESKGLPYISNVVVVSVTCPVINKLTLQMPDIDKSTEGGTPFSGAQVFENSESITRIIDVTTDADILIEYSNGNVINSATLSSGERVWEVYNQVFAYKVNIVVANLILKTASDLTKIQAAGGVVKETFESGGTQTLFTYDGYFLLGNNIDATTLVDPIGASVCGYNSKWAIPFVERGGFQGIFEGRGFTINGLKTKVGGLFGDLGKNGVIKNLALTNAHHTKSLLVQACAGGKIENVFVQFVNTTAQNYSAGVVTTVYSGTFKDIVVNSVTLGTAKPTEIGTMFSWQYGKATATNMYSIALGSITAAIAKFESTLAIADRMIITELTAATLPAATFATFDEYWRMTDSTTESGIYPCFKTAFQYLKVKETPETPETPEAPEAPVTP